MGGQFSAALGGDRSAEGLVTGFYPIDQCGTDVLVVTVEVEVLETVCVVVAGAS